MALKLGGKILRQICQATTQQRLHDNSGYTLLRKFCIKIAGIDITLAYLVGIVPVKIVELYLHEVPVILIMHGEHLIEDTLLSVERESKITDTSCLALFKKEIHDAIVDITSMKLIHASTNGMQQIIVDIIHLEFLHRVKIHPFRLLKRPVVVVKIREFRSHEILITLMAAQGNASATLRLSLTIDRRSIEIVQPMFDSIIHLFVDHLLIKLIAIIHLRRQAHHAISQQRHFLLSLGIHTICHLALWRLYLILVFLSGFVLRLVGFLTPHQRNGSTYTPRSQHLQEPTSRYILIFLCNHKAQSSKFNVQSFLCTSCPSTYIAENGRDGHTYSQAPHPMQAASLMAGIIGDSSSFSSIGTISMAPEGQ